MNEKVNKMNPVVGLSFEQLSSQNVTQVSKIFTQLGGFKMLEFIKMYGYIGVNGRLLKVDYVTFMEDKIVFEPIKE